MTSGGLLGSNVWEGKHSCCVCLCVCLCLSLSRKPHLRRVALRLCLFTVPISYGGGSLFRHQHLGPCGQDICGFHWRRLRLHEARLSQGKSAGSSQALGHGILEDSGCCGCVPEGMPCCRVLPDGSGGEFLADS